MTHNSSLLTLDRLRLAVTRNETAKKRAASAEDGADVAALQSDAPRDVRDLS